MSFQIYDGMYDQYATVAAVHEAWMRDRKAIDPWHDEGRTRARLATIAANRCAVLRAEVPA